MCTAPAIEHDLSVLARGPGECEPQHFGRPDIHTGNKRNSLGQPGQQTNTILSSEINIMLWPFAPAFAHVLLNTPRERAHVLLGLVELAETGDLDNHPTTWTPNAAVATAAAVAAAVAAAAPVADAVAAAAAAAASVAAAAATDMRHALARQPPSRPMGLQELAPPPCEFIRRADHIPP